MAPSVGRPTRGARGRVGSGSQRLGVETATPAWRSRPRQVFSWFSDAMSRVLFGRGAHFFMPSSRAGGGGRGTHRARPAGPHVGRREARPTENGLSFPGRTRISQSARGWDDWMRQAHTQARSGGLANGKRGQKGCARHLSVSGGARWSGRDPGLVCPGGSH